MDELACGAAPCICDCQISDALHNATKSARLPPGPVADSSMQPHLECGASPEGALAAGWQGPEALEAVDLLRVRITAFCKDPWWMWRLCGPDRHHVQLYALVLHVWSKRIVTRGKCAFGTRSQQVCWIAVHVGCSPLTNLC